MAGDETVEFEEASIEELAASMASGSLTSRGLTEAYLERIEAVDPALHSVLETTPTRSRSPTRSTPSAVRVASEGRSTALPHPSLPKEEFRRTACIG